jgi:hypothetical protein
VPLLDVDIAKAISDILQNNVKDMTILSSFRVRGEPDRFLFGEGEDPLN